MATNCITILETNYDLIVALAACWNVDITVVAEYDDMLEIDVTGSPADVGHFAAACNEL